MKNKFLKILILFTAFTIIVSSFTGCGKKDDNNSQSESQSSENEITTPDDPHLVKELLKTDDHARNSEGAFIKMKDGRIAYVFSRYGAKSSDNDYSDIAVMYSSDDGSTFSDPETILTASDADAFNLMSVSLLHMNDDSIGVFYLKKSKDHKSKMFLRKTKDFKTFTDEVLCTNTKDGNWFVVNNDRVVRLKNGRIIVPAAYSETSSGNSAVAKFYSSDDDGKTFNLLSSVTCPHSFIKTGLQEPGIIELEDKIVAFFRNDSGRQYMSYSTDNCQTWTTAEPSRFTSPASPMSAKMMKNGRIIAIYNPVPNYYGQEQSFDGVFTGGRTPLVASICKGNLDNEYKEFVLESEKTRAFCYTAIFELENHILLAYNAGGAPDGFMFHRLKIVKYSKEELRLNTRK